MTNDFSTLLSIPKSTLPANARSSIFSGLGIGFAVVWQRPFLVSLFMNIDDFRKNPHDALFRLLMSEPKNIKAYTEKILSKTIHTQCRWEDLEIIQTDFIDEALNERRSDLLYRVPCGEGVIAFTFCLSISPPTIHRCH